MFCVQSAVTDIPVVSLLAKAMQFLLVERRDTDDQHFKHSHKGRVTNLIHERAQDTRCALQTHDLLQAASHTLMQPSWKQNS